MLSPKEQTWPDTLWLVRHGESSGNVARNAAEAAGLSPSTSHTAMWTSRCPRSESVRQARSVAGSRNSPRSRDPTVISDVPVSEGDADDQSTHRSCRATAEMRWFTWSTSGCAKKSSASSTASPRRASSRSIRPRQSYADTSASSTIAHPAARAGVTCSCACAACSTRSSCSTDASACSSSPTKWSCCAFAICSRP